MPPSHRVLMYSRSTCGLCDQARAVLLAERARNPFELHEVMIDGRPELERDFGLRVPVVLVDGIERFEYSVDPARLRGLVRP